MQDQGDERLKQMDEDVKSQWKETFFPRHERDEVLSRS